MSERARSGPAAAAAPHVVIADPDPDTRTRMAACVRALSRPKRMAAVTASPVPVLSTMRVCEGGM